MEGDSLEVYTDVLARTEHREMGFHLLDGL